MVQDPYKQQRATGTHERAALDYCDRAGPENTQPVLSLIACLQSQGKPVPPELEERSLRIWIEQEPENTQPVLSLIACLLRQGKSVPPELEERSLRIWIEQEPDNTQPVLSLIACLQRQGKSVPPELEERSLRIWIEREPENTQPMLSLIACLQRQGKPVPPELEERSLRIWIEREPENTQPVLSLIACLQRQGKPVPVELHEQSLWIAVEQNPGDARRVARLLSCLLRQGKPAPPHLAGWRGAMVEQDLENNKKAFPLSRFFDRIEMPWDKWCDQAQVAQLLEKRISDCNCPENGCEHVSIKVQDHPRANCSAFAEFLGRVDHIKNIHSLLDEVETFGCVPGYPHFRNFSADDFRNFIVEAIIRGHAARDRYVPTMPIFSWPKSGSAFVASALASIMDVPVGTVSVAHTAALRSSASFLARFPIAVHDHMPPLESNARVLQEAGVRRFALLIRDPRQAAVSLAYHDLVASSTPQTVRPNTAQAYDRAKLDTTMDRALDFVSSFAANWFNDWKRFGAKTDFEVVFLKHEDLAVDSDRFLHNVLEFFDAPVDLHDKVRDALREAESSRDSGGLNWRLGQTDEWKATLSRDQIDRLRARLGGAFDNLYDI